MITPRPATVRGTPSTAATSEQAMLKYYLSTSQIKQLTASGREFRIALPTPLEEPADLFTWARDAIEQYGGLIESVELVTVSVVFKAGKDGLEGCLGQICSEVDPADGSIIDTFGAEAMLSLRCEVLLCSLVPENPRHGPAMGNEGYKIQWPGKALRGDQRWPLPKVPRVSDAGTAEAEFWKRQARQLAQLLNAHRHATHSDNHALIDLVLETTKQGERGTSVP